MAKGIPDSLERIQKLKVGKKRKVQLIKRRILWLEDTFPEWADGEDGYFIKGIGEDVIERDDLQDLLDELVDDDG